MSKLDPRALEAAALAWDREDVAQMGELACARAGITAYLDALSSSPAAEPVAMDYRLPCEVLLPPRTKFRKGCSLSTLMMALQQREAYPPEHTKFAAPVELDALRRERDEARAAYDQLLTRWAESRERHLTAEATLDDVMRQAESDLASAHAEICKLQGLDPETHSWPEWSPQANTLRWLAKIRQDRLSRKDTDNE